MDDETLALLPLRSTEAEAALTRLARDVPHDIELGRPVIAAYSGSENAVVVVTDLGGEDSETLWWSYPGHAERLVTTTRPQGRTCELVKWYGGVEYERSARIVPDTGE